MFKKIALFFFAIMFSTIPAHAEHGSLKMSVFPVPPNLAAAIKFYEPSGNNILDGDETGRIIITVRNTGKGDAFDVRAELKEERNVKGLFFERDVLIGHVPAGKIVEKEVELRATDEIATGNITITVAIKEVNGFEPSPLKISFQTKAFEPPKLIVADIGINDQNGNGRVEPMEMVELTIRVQNIGHGGARSVIADVQAGQNVFIGGDSVTHFVLGNIQSGKLKDFKFMFYTNNRIENGEKIPIMIHIDEARPKFKERYPLALTMNAIQTKLEEVIVKGEDMDKKAEITLAGGLSVDVDTNIPEGQKAGKYDIAVVIGNGNYSISGAPNVEFAIRDARIMKEYLLRTMGYDQTNIIYAEDATLSKFNEIFGTKQDHRQGRLFKFVKKDISRVFVYYVGHGAPDLESQEAFLVPVDANPDYLRSNGYRLQTFYDNLSQVPAKHMTVVLDACFSGNSAKGMLFKNISPAMIKVKKEFRGPTNAVLFTSAAVDQVSTWYPEKKHSLFTYYFLKGLQGAADANGDGKITVGEMQEYLKENVPYMAQRLNGREQYPVVMGNAGAVIAVLKKKK